MHGVDLLVDRAYKPSCTCCISELGDEIRWVLASGLPNCPKFGQNYSCPELSDFEITCPISESQNRTS